MMPELKIIYTKNNELGRLDFTLSKLDYYKSQDIKVSLPTDFEVTTSLDRLRVIVDSEYPNNKALKAKDEISKSWVLHRGEISVYLGSMPFRKIGLINLQLTQYGTAGSYNAKTNTIIINTNFGVDLLSILVHELTHIVVEARIVKKFNLEHQQKENLVKWLITSSPALASFIEVPAREPIKAPQKEVLSELKLLGYSSL